MNSELRKAIEEATGLTSFRLSVAQAKISEENGNSVPWYPRDKVAELVDANDKLLRVIEMLVQQRDDALDHAATSKSNFTWQQGHLNAELIAALKQERI